MWTRLTGDYQKLSPAALGGVRCKILTFQTSF